MSHCSSFSSKWVSLMFKIRIRFPRTWRIHSNIALEVGLSEVIGLAVIPYYLTIWYFMNSWLIKSDPWSYMISIGLGYLVNHVVSNKFAIYIALLTSYYVILNHPATRYIMATDFRLKFSFFTFLHMN